MTSLVHRIKNKIVLGNASSEANEDLFPSPPETRTWKWWNYSALWAGQSLDASWVRYISLISFHVC